MASIAPSERLPRELEAVIGGAREELDPIEAIGTPCTRSSPPVRTGRTPSRCSTSAAPTHTAVSPSPE
jgi:hypothetical protein